MTVHACGVVFGHVLLADFCKVLPSTLNYTRTSDSVKKSEGTLRKRAIFLHFSGVATARQELC